MRLRGSFVQRLISFFEGSKISDSKPNCSNIGETQFAETATPSTSAQLTQEDATAIQVKPTQSLLHASVFSIPSLQMLFAMVGFRLSPQSLINITEYCRRLFYLNRFTHQPATLPYTLKHLPDCSPATDLAHLNHLRDVLDNVNARPRKLRSQCRASTSRDDPPIWPTRTRRRHRHCSADSPKRNISPQQLPTFGPPTLAEALTLETFVSESRKSSCDSRSLQSFDAEVTANIKGVETLAPFQTGQELTAEKKQATMKRQKRKFRHISSKKMAQTSEVKGKNPLLSARKEFLQKRQSKKEMRRVRRFFDYSLNPSLFTQFCKTKGSAPVTEHIEWKTSTKKQNTSPRRAASPEIEIWMNLAARDAFLQNKLLKIENPSSTTTSMTSLPLVTSPKRKEEALPVLNKKPTSSSFPNRGRTNRHATCLTRLASKGTSTTMVSKKNARCGCEVKMVDAGTQTTCLTAYEEPVRRKDCRSKSEGSCESRSVKDSARQATKRFLDFINVQSSCVTGGRQRANDKEEALEFRQFLLTRFLENSETSILEELQSNVTPIGKSKEKIS